MKTKFSLVMLKDDLDKIRLMLLIAGANKLAKQRKASQNLNLRLTPFDACVDVIPMPSLLSIVEERDLRPNTLLIPAGGCKDVMPLLGCLFPPTDPAHPGTRVGLFAPIESLFDLAICFASEGEYTAYVDGSVLEEGPAGWRLAETDDSGAAKFFTLTKEGNDAYLEIAP